MAPKDETNPARRRGELNRKLRQEFLAGAEERSRRELGRGLTPDELERILKVSGRSPRAIGRSSAQDLHDRARRVMDVRRDAG
jgi:hypothetical protein